MKPLHEKIREYRMSQGITQTHISKLTGISNKKISFIETGVTELKAEDFILIVEKGFGLSTSFFTNQVLETTKAERENK